MVLLAGGTEIVKCDEKDGFKLSPKKLKKAISKNKMDYFKFSVQSNRVGLYKKRNKELAKVLLKNKKLTF